jgi:hypothetical protein
MTRKSALHVLASFALVFGLITIAGALWLDDTSSFLRATSATAGALLVLAAWQLWLKKSSAVAILWLSVAVYFASIFIPALARHGAEVFSALIPAFYWSLSVRVVLSVLAYFVVTSAAAKKSEA